MRSGVRVTGLKEAMREMDALADRARHVDRALRLPQTQEEFEKSAERAFAVGGFRPVGERWAQRKRREGLDSRAMRATGQLQDALTNTSDGVEIDVTGTTLRWRIAPGSRVAYASSLAKDPRRQPMRVDRLAERRVSDRIGRFLRDGFAGSAIGA